MKTGKLQGSYREATGKPQGSYREAKLTRC